MEEEKFSTKRSREEEEEEWAPELPQAKRLREDLLFDILDEVESSDPNPPADLDCVVRSLEIALLRPPPPPPPPSLAEQEAGDEEEYCEARQLELGYLLEASDDELGLPPSTSSSSSEEIDDGFVWGFEDGVSSCCYVYGMDDNNKNNLLAGCGTQAAEQEEEGGWFGAAMGFFDGDGDVDVDVFWPLEWPELAFQPETLPAV